MAKRDRRLVYNGEQASVEKVLRRRKAADAAAEKEAARKARLYPHPSNGKDAPAGGVGTLIGVY